MASGGGYQPNKQTKSEPKRRSNWQRSVSSDRDDAQSLNSLPSDIRINNWDLADLRPMNFGGDSKRRKKSKGNPEREREQSLSVDSPPHDQKHHAPSSYPRTKITPSTPTSRRVALENLKQHMTFSDLEDQVSTDGERNNERQVSQSRRRLHNASFNRTDSENDVRGARERHINRNNNMDYTIREQGPDSNEIVARLMQIRDFMKQARSMLESMEKLGDRKKTEDIEKVRRLIRNLQEQEQGYRGLLQNTLTQPNGDEDGAVGGEDDTPMKVEVEKDDSDDDTSVDLEVRTEESETTENSQDSRPRIESKLGIGSDDEEREEEDEYEEPLRGAAGNTSDNANCNRVAELENTLLQGQQFSQSGVPVQESEEGARGSTAIDGEDPIPKRQDLLRILQEKQKQLQDLMSRQEELNLKRRETEKKLLEAQARDNKARAALAAVSTGRQFVEQRLATQQALAREVAAWGGEIDGDGEERGAVGEDRVLKSNIVGYPESDDEDNSNVREVETLPNELLELKRQLNFLRNEFSQFETPKNMEPVPVALTEGRQQLQNKLQELQDKKSRMDSLLQELQMLHAQPLESLRNNETNPQASNAQLVASGASNIPAPRQASQKQQLPQEKQAKSSAVNLPPSTGLPVNLQAMMNDMASSTPAAVENAMATFAQLARGADAPDGDNMDPQMMEEVQEKLRRLKEVRGQLDQLRSLVQYYQGQGQRDERETGGDGDDQLSLPGFSDTGDLATLLGQTSAEVRGSRSSLLQQQQQQELLSLQRQLQQQQQQQQQRQQQSRQQRSESGGAGAGSLHSMAQLLNLEGTDQGDEHSDEDNVSVSQSESQWSRLGPWDDDPEIQEKVKKLKAAKEKLRQLQDLVAFVQQSPDAARALPEGLGDLAASVEGEAVSQATQTDEPNVSVSEGEVPSESMRMPQREDEMDGIENPREELEKLRKERAMLLEIQSQLKQIHDQVGRAPGAQGGEMQDRAERDPDMGKSGSEQAPNATVVTFASNDELYSKMRRQRILREELRSKKKELEAIMKKDRNKRQYSRNQDNQSDTVSLNTDTFGIPASVDATMATWGGSTVDNLENITEDEDGQERNDHSNRDDNDEDDGYPSDGIVQVEEEEEENDSDNGTYTIEADARQRKNLRKGPGMGLGARPKTSRGRQTYPKPSYNDKATKKTSKKQNSSRSSHSQRDSNLKQENFRSAQQLIQDEEDMKEQNSEWFRTIDERLSNLGVLVGVLLRKLDNEGRQLSVSLSQENAPQGSSLMSPMQEQMLQLQNQSMMLSFGQLVQSLTRQQGDMQHLQQQMQALQMQIQEVQHDHSFHGTSHLMQPAMSNPTLNNSNFNLQAAASVGAHSLSVNQQPMPSPFTQSNLNNTAPAGYFSHYSANSPGLSQIHRGGLGLSTSNLSLGRDRGATGGLAAGLSINTGSSLSLPQQTAGSGFVFNPLGQSTLNSQSSHTHQASQAGGSSASTMTRDFSQFVNTLQSTPPPSANLFGQFSSLFGSSSQQQQQPSSGTYPSLSAKLRQDENEIEEESPLPRLNSYTFDNRSKKRKMGTGVKKSESDPTSGLRMSTPSVDNLQSRGDGVGSGQLSWEREGATDYRTMATGAGFDGSGIAFDGGSSYSSIQSIRDQHTRMRGEQTRAKSGNASGDSNTLFDTLRDTIYTEVASLISQNESRPHFLLELFRDMRQIDSDLLRQRTLFSIQELVRSNPSLAGSSSAPSWAKGTSNPLDTANSEQTPSESVTSEDDDDLKVTRLQEEITAAERSRLDRLARSRVLRNFPFDYAETADNPSSLSTPTNGCEDSPFFQDTLGETVIEFDSLKREVQDRQGSSQTRFNRQGNQTEDGKRSQRYGKGGFLASDMLMKDMRSSKSREKRRAREAAADGGLRSHGSQSSEVASSSAMDQASESSMSDMPVSLMYPRIDMRQLDRQIKDIMMETIPVVKEHMDDICTSQLLSYIKRLVLSLTSQMGNQEFARFFHRQLASILEDMLMKYQGRKMRDCGEDLLVEISDVLFNELAFFRLMQDLDDPNVASKVRATEWPNQAGSSNEKPGFDYSASSSSDEADDDENDGDNDDDDDENKITGDNNDEAENNAPQRGFRITEAEQDELGKERDDEMAKEVSIRDSEEKDDDETEQSYKIELAVSETKPFTRIGSDEDDDEGDEERSMDDPSETAVSRDSMMETNGRSEPTNPPSTRPEAEGAHGDGIEKQDQEKPISPSRSNQAGVGKPQGDGDTAEVPATTDTAQMNGTVNGGDADNSEEELTVDDLPERLTVAAAAITTTSASASGNNSS